MKISLWLNSFQVVDICNLRWEFTSSLRQQRWNTAVGSFALGVLHCMKCWLHFLHMERKRVYTVLMGCLCAAFRQASAFWFSRQMPLKLLHLKKKKKKRERKKLSPEQKVEWWLTLHSGTKPTRASLLLRSTTSYQKQVALLPGHKSSVWLMICFMFVLTGWSPDLLDWDRHAHAGGGSRGWIWERGGGLVLT